MSRYAPGTSPEYIREMDAHMYADDPAYTGTPPNLSHQTLPGNRGGKGGAGVAASGGGKGGQQQPRPNLSHTTYPGNTGAAPASIAGKGGQSVAGAPQSVPVTPMQQDFMARDNDRKAALEFQSNELRNNAGSLSSLGMYNQSPSGASDFMARDGSQTKPTFNPNPAGGKGGQDPSHADPSWKPMEPTIPQQTAPAETPTFNPNPMGGKGGQQQPPPSFNPYPMGGKGGYGGMQGGKGGYGQVSVNPYVQGGKGGSSGGKGGYGRPSPYSQPMGGKGGGSMPQPSASSSSGGKGGQQTGGNPYAIARPSASSGGKGGSTGGKGG